MSTDARQSIYLWIGGLVFCGLFWAGLHFDVFGGVSNKWFWPLVGIVGVANLAQTAWGFWQRRAWNPDNPNHR